jgi:hypothetical protein
VNYLRGMLSAVAGTLFALIGPTLVVIFRGITAEKATGFAMVFGGFSEAFRSRRLWILAFLFFLLLWAASRLNNKLLRAFLFWAPTILIFSITLAFVALFVYVRFRSG